MALLVLACGTGGPAAMSPAASTPVAAEIRIARPFHPAPATSVEFARADGSTLRIDSGERHYTENGVTVSERTWIAASERFAAVTREHIEPPYARSNTVTLYDARGEALFERTGVDHLCVQVSRTGEAIACIAMADEHVDGPPSPQPDANTILVLGRDGAERARFREPPGSVGDRDVRLSSNGRWLAYTVRGARRRIDHVMLHDLETGTATEIPAREDERIGHLAMVTDDGDLLRVRPGEEAAASFTRTGVLEMELVWHRPR